MGFYLCLLILVGNECSVPAYSGWKSARYLWLCLLKPLLNQTGSNLWHWGWSWKRHPSRTTHFLQTEGRVCDTYGRQEASVLSIASAFITLYGVTLIKPSDQIIRSSGFDSTVGWTGFVKLVKPYVFCCWKQSYFSSTAILNFFTIDSVQHLIIGYSSMCPGRAEE